MLGTSVVARTARLLTTGRLRVLAYHGVPDPHSFRLQMEHVARCYSPVGGAQVIAATEGRHSLREHSVWVTFDDGRPDVVENAEPILSRLGVPATLFVVAGLIDTDEPFWWSVVERAQADGIVTDPTAVSALKRRPDAERREQVAALAREIADRRGLALRTPQLTSDELSHWVAAGFEVGNHSWDHPCLDQSSPDQQVAQVREAHHRLTTLVGDEPRLFAYPNGNWSAPVDGELKRLNYSVALLFDHRLATPSGNPLQMSRLRIDSTASVARFRAIVSGAHPCVFAAQSAARRAARRLATRSHGPSEP